MNLDKTLESVKEYIDSKIKNPYFGSGIAKFSNRES
jgi:hypothetical protein